MKKYLLIFSVVFIFSPCNSKAKTILTLATGGKGGVYFALGPGIKKAIEKENPDVDVVVLSTEGSVENAKLIDARSVHLAFIQNDIAYYFFKGERMSKFPSNRIMGIASLYTEVIQIIGRKELNIEKISDLKGKIVAVGPEKSGTEFNSAAILSAAGIEYDDITEMFLSFEEAKDSLINGSIDAVFITAGVPTPAIIELGEKINIVPIDIETITKLRKTYPFFVATTIPANSYKGQYKKVFAIGVRALLVTQRSLKSSVVEQVTKAIFNEPEILKSAHSVAYGIKLESSMTGMTIPLHPGAEKYYREKKVIERRFTDYFPRMLSILICILILVLIIRYRYLLRRIIRKNIYLKLSLVLFAFFITGTIGTYLFERSVNENFITFYQSFWTTMVYLISGFEGAGPITTGGKISSVLIFIGSIGILGSVAGNFAYIFMKKGEAKMPKNVIKHIAICNWNMRGDRIVKELHHPDAEPETEIIILTNREVNEAELRQSKRYENVYFIRGDPTSHDTLRDSRVHLAKSVIILADEGIPDPDPITALICLAITRLTNPEDKPHIIVEILNYQKREHLIDAGADEVIAAGFYRTGIIVQSALYPNLSDVYHQLLVYSGDTNEMYIVSGDKFPKVLIGKTFKEASEIINRHRNPKNPAILVGVRRGKQVILNPKDESEESKGRKFERFQEGDALIVMSYSLPILSKLKE